MGESAKTCFPLCVLCPQLLGVSMGGYNMWGGQKVLLLLFIVCEWHTQYGRQVEMLTGVRAGMLV